MILREIRLDFDYEPNELFIKQLQLNEGLTLELARTQNFAPTDKEVLIYHQIPDDAIIRRREDE